MEIIIRGPAMSGKSQVARAIRQILADYGADVAVEDNDYPLHYYYEPPYQHAMRGRSITIRMEQTIRKLPETSD